MPLTAFNYPGRRRSLGRPVQYIEPLAAASVAAGVDGIFIEVHEDPSQALSDGATALPLARLAPLVERLGRIWTATRDLPARAGESA